MEIQISLLKLLEGLGYKSSIKKDVNCFSEMELFQLYAFLFATHDQKLNWDATTFTSNENLIFIIGNCQLMGVSVPTKLVTKPKEEIKDFLIQNISNLGKKIELEKKRKEEEIENQNPNPRNSPRSYSRELQRTPVSRSSPLLKRVQSSANLKRLVESSPNVKKFVPLSPNLKRLVPSSPILKQKLISTPNKDSKTTIADPFQTKAKLIFSPHAFRTKGSIKKEVPKEVPKEVNKHDIWKKALDQQITNEPEFNYRVVKKEEVIVEEEPQNISRIPKPRSRTLSKGNNDILKSSVSAGIIESPTKNQVILQQEQKNSTKDNRFDSFRRDVEAFEKKEIVILEGTLKKGLKLENLNTIKSKEFVIALQRSQFIVKVVKEKRPTSWKEVVSFVESAPQFGKSSTITKNKWRDVCDSYSEK